MKKFLLLVILGLFAARQEGQHGIADQVVRQPLAREQAARRVNAAYAIEAVKDEAGVRPAHIKDRIRALGPTVLPALTLKPADPSAGNWVI